MDSLHDFNLPSLPPEALAKLSKLEVVANTARQTADYSKDRVKDIDAHLAVDPDGAGAEALKTERAELVAQRKTFAERHRSHGALFANVNQWLRTVPTSRVFEYAPAKASLRKGESIDAALERVRSAILAHKKEQWQISRMPPAKSDLKRQAKDWVARIGTQLKPNVRVHDGELRVDMTSLGSLGVGGDTSSASSGFVPIVLRLLTMAVPDAMERLLLRQVEAMPDNPDALPEADKQARMAKLTAELDQLEREEEALVLLAWKQGRTDIARRLDASPIAVLEIRAVKRKPLLPPAKPNGKANGAHETESLPRLKSKHAARLKELEDETEARS